MNSGREVLCAVVELYAGFKPSLGQIETEVAIDAERDHYELVHVGWDDKRWVHGPVVLTNIIGDTVCPAHIGWGPSNLRSRPQLRGDVHRHGDRHPPPTCAAQAGIGSRLRWHWRNWSRGQSSRATT